MCWRFSRSIRSTSRRGFVEPCVGHSLVYKINLTKIQSLPIIGHEWEYLFYVDVMYDDLTRYRQSIDAIIPLTKDLKILGEYKDGKQTN